MILPVKRNLNNKFTIVTVHYSADPEKSTTEWIAKAKEGMTERGWNREYEIDYTSFAGKPVWDTFDPKINVAKEELPVKYGEIMYRGWDFGYHHPCCIITRLNEQDQWLWLKCILGNNEFIKDFGLRVKRFCESEYPGSKYIDAGDIAGTQVKDAGEASVKVLATLGIAVRSQKQLIKMGIELVGKKMCMRADGKPGILINPNQEYLIDMCKGGLHYPEAREGQPEKEFYEKDGYYDHGGDAIRYLATEIFDTAGSTQLTNELTQDENQLRYQMGSPNYGEANELTGGIEDFFS